MNGLAFYQKTKNKLFIKITQLKNNQKWNY